VSFSVAVANVTCIFAESTDFVVPLDSDSVVIIIYKLSCKC